MDQTNPSYDKIMHYIEQNPAGVLGTAGEDGPHGAVVYVIPASHATLCFVTKNQTKKYANILAQPQVCLTFFNEKESTTLQAVGKAYVADDKQGLKELIMNRMAQAHATQSNWLPPVTELAGGDYAVIGVELSYARLTDFSQMDVAGPTVTELQ